MGKQVRFFALLEDEKRFWDFVRSVPKTYRLHVRSTQPDIGSFVVPWDDEPSQLIFREYFIAKGDLGFIEPFVKSKRSRIYSEEEMEYLGGENYFRIDTDGPVIEYTSSFLRDDGKLAQGRIWTDFYRLEGNEFVYKGEDFKVFYETLAEWIKKNFKKLKGVDGYFGQEALAWYESGERIV